ncbi:MAG TPA: HAMP domain-containing sensor histidine kinase [Anaeromyxobacteraceae bacterium]|nr:HAMP domain-containing sensor histidine kinase [Anaeromyxobacteraceae bacterium]
MDTPARPVRAYAIAVALALAALGLVQGTRALLGGPHLYFPISAVFLSALLGGLGPGLTAVGVCGMGFDFFFLGPPLHLGVGTVAEGHQLAGFLFFGVAAVVVSARFRSARMVAERQRQAAEAAEAEARRVGGLQERLVAMVSHDLGGPLAVMRSGLELLPRLGDLSDGQRRAVESLRRTSRRMEGLVDGLLDLARSRHGGALPLRLAPARLGEIAVRAVSEAEAVQPGADIRIEVEGDDQGLLDAQRLEQVVGNLLRNAFDHGTRDGPVEVAVRASAADLVLEVRNAGAPIPPEVLPGIFEPFRRGKKDGTGLGLGLFIVREVVLAHGGAVDVRSDGTGTVVAATLPRRPRQDAAGADASRR